MDTTEKVETVVDTKDKLINKTVRVFLPIDHRVHGVYGKVTGVAVDSKRPFRTREGNHILLPEILLVSPERWEKLNTAWRNRRVA